MRIIASFSAPLLLLGIAVASGAASAELYRYTDANGTEQFTMSLEAVPEAYRAQAAERAREASKRFNVVGANPRAARPSPARAQPAPSPALGQTATPSHSEGHWRAQFRSQRRAVESAERELESAEAADKTTRAGRSSSAASAQTRRARAALREEKAERRIRKAEEKLEAAEQAMHELRQLAVEEGIPDHWMH